MANLRSRRKITTVKAEAVLTVGKQGVVKSWVSPWMAEALMEKATREGWGHLLTIKIVNVELGVE